MLSWIKKEFVEHFRVCKDEPCIYIYIYEIN